LRVRARAPGERPEGAVPTLVAVLEAGRRGSASEARGLRRRLLAILRMHELDERPRLELLDAPAQDGLPGGAQPGEVAPEVGDAQEVHRQGEEALELGLELPALREVGLDPPPGRGQEKDGEGPPHPHEAEYPFEVLLALLQ